MSSLTFQKPAAPGQWLRLYKLYRTAFPASERKPFSMIVKMYRRGKTDLWCISRDGVFVGLAATINGEDLILLDYFAVEQNIRGQGVGSEALRALQKIYSGKGLFVEIESPYDDSPNRAERQRRQLGRLPR